MSIHLACDLGAESGRLMLGTLAEGRLTLEEIHRFPNTPIRDGDSLHWNIPALCEELTTGLRLAAARNLPIASISTDSWGLDYVLLDERGQILPPTFCYRDPRTAQGMRNALSRVDWPTIFTETGIQNMPINTLYQLAAEGPARLVRAKMLLGIGDFFNWFLSGQAVAEVSLASTFQLYNPRIGNWSELLLNALNLPRKLFPRIVPSGTRLGPLTALRQQETSLPGIQVVASCSHDTGAAVAAVPVAAVCDRRPSGGSGRAATGVASQREATHLQEYFRDAHRAPLQLPDWAYISSGTWSLMGVERSEPILSDEARELNFTNEIGHGNTVRLLKNIIGLWLVQECRRHWAAQGNDFDYATLADLAADATPFRSLINPADPRFLPPGDMPGRIAAFCRETGQPAPETPGQFIRCALESLALLYRKTLLQVEQLTGAKIERLHVVGGGSRNALLNQLTANACQIPVLAGPIEATSIGNILVQAIGLGQIQSLAKARSIVRESFDVTVFEPSDAASWQAVLERFLRLI